MEKKVRLSARGLQSLLEEIASLDNPYRARLARVVALLVDVERDRAMEDAPELKRLDHCLRIRKRTLEVKMMEWKKD